nr:MAG TPA: hypothetical protein [Bacteriophage sp.]
MLPLHHRGMNRILTIDPNRGIVSSLTIKLDHLRVFVFAR